MITLIGSIAAFLTSIQFFPQVKTTWEKRHDTEALMGVSMPTFATLTTSSILWIIYGIGNVNFVIIVPNCFALGAIVTTLFLVINGRRQLTKSALVTNQPESW